MGGLLKKAEDTLKKKNLSRMTSNGDLDAAGEDFMKDLSDLAQQDSLFSDNISLVQQYLEVSEDYTNPKPWQTKKDKEMLEKLLGRMKEAKAKLDELFTQL